MRARYPRTALVLTLGADGVLFDGGGVRLREPARTVRAVDTTAAGDTFLGYFLAEAAREFAQRHREPSVDTIVKRAADRIEALAQTGSRGG